MKKHVFAQVRPLDLTGEHEWLAAEDPWLDADEAPPVSGVRWMCKVDDWYMTPAAGFIPLTRVVH